MMENTEPSRNPGHLNAEAPAKRFRLFFLLSASLNVTLLLWIAWVCLKPASQAVETFPSSDFSSQASEQSPTTDNERPSHRAAAVSPWKQLESPDPAVYAANLRAAGCPPKTMRDILLPLIEEKFGYRDASGSEPVNFWASFSQRQVAAAARAEQESALEQQKDTMLIELLGFPWTSEGLKQAYAGEAAGALGFLDYERAEKFLCMAERFKPQFSRANGLYRRDRRSVIYHSWRQEAGEVLSPVELEEIELRGMLMVGLRRHPNLFQAGLSGSELRQLMIFRREHCTPLLSALVAGGEQLVQEPDSTDERQFQSKVRRLLGNSRFLEYLKSCDPSIERTIAALEKEQLPRSLALEVFDFRQEVTVRAQEIRQLPVRRAEKRVQLAALRQNALEQLAALSDDKTEGPLLQINEDWLQEIANP